MRTTSLSSRKSACQVLHIGNDAMSPSITSVMAFNAGMFTTKRCGPSPRLKPPFPTAKQPCVIRRPRCFATSGSGTSIAMPAAMRSLAMPTKVWWSAQTFGMRVGKSSHSPSASSMLRGFDSLCRIKPSDTSSTSTMPPAPTLGNPSRTRSMLSISEGKTSSPL